MRAPLRRVLAVFLPLLALAGPAAADDGACAGLTKVDQLFAAQQNGPARRLLGDWEKAQARKRPDGRIRAAWAELQAGQSGAASSSWQEANSLSAQGGALCDPEAFKVWSGVVAVSLDCPAADRQEECQEHLRTLPSAAGATAFPVLDVALLADVWRASLLHRQGKPDDAAAILQAMSGRMQPATPGLYDLDALRSAKIIAGQLGRPDLVLALAPVFPDGSTPAAVDWRWTKRSMLLFQDLVARLQMEKCATDERSGECPAIAQELASLSDRTDTALQDLREERAQIANTDLLTPAETAEAIRVLAGEARILRSNLILTKAQLSDFAEKREELRERLLTDVDPAHVNGREYHMVMYGLERDRAPAAAADHLEAARAAPDGPDIIEHQLWAAQHDLAWGAPYRAELALRRVLGHLSSEAEQHPEWLSATASLLIEALVQQGKGDLADAELRNVRALFRPVGAAELSAYSEMLLALSQARMALPQGRVTEAGAQLGKARVAYGRVSDRPDLLMDLLALEAQTAAAAGTTLAPDHAEVLFRHYFEGNGSLRMTPLDVFSVLAESLVNHRGAAAARRALTDLATALDERAGPSSERRFLLAATLGRIALGGGMATEAVADYRGALSALTGDRALSGDPSLVAAIHLRLAQALTMNGEAREAAGHAAAARRVFQLQPRRHEQELQELAAIPQPAQSTADPAGTVQPAPSGSVTERIKAELARLSDDLDAGDEEAQAQVWWLLGSVPSDSADAFVLALAWGESLMAKSNLPRSKAAEALLRFEQASRAAPVEDLYPRLLIGWAEAEQKLGRRRQAATLYRALIEHLAYRSPANAKLGARANAKLANLYLRLDEPFQAALILRTLSDGNCDHYRDFLDALGKAKSLAEGSADALRLIDAEFGTPSFDCPDQIQFAMLEDRLNGSGAGLSVPWTKPGSAREWQARRLEHAIAGAMAAAGGVEREIVAATVNLKARDPASIPASEWRALQHICDNDALFRQPSENSSLSAALVELCRTAAERLDRFGTGRDGPPARAAELLTSDALVMSLMAGDTEAARTLFVRYRDRLIAKQGANDDRSSAERVAFNRRISLAKRLIRQGRGQQAGQILDWLEAELHAWPDADSHRRAADRINGSRALLAAMSGNVDEAERMIQAAVAAQDQDRLARALDDLDDAILALQRTGASGSASRLLDTALGAANQFKLDDELFTLHARASTLNACRSAISDARRHFEAASAQMARGSADDRKEKAASLRDAAFVLSKYALLAGDAGTASAMMAESRRLSALAETDAEQPPEVLLWMGRVAAAQGHWEAAAAAFDSATLASFDPDLVVRVAAWYLKEGRRDEAMARLEPTLAGISPPLDLPGLPSYLILLTNQIRAAELALSILDDGTPEGLRKAADLVRRLGLWTVPSAFGDAEMLNFGDALDAPVPFAVVRQRFAERVLAVLARMPPGTEGPKRETAAGAWAQDLMESITARAMARARQRASAKGEKAQILKRLGEFEALLRRRAASDPDEAKVSFFSLDPCRPDEGSLESGGPASTEHNRRSELASLIGQYAMLSEDTPNMALRQDGTGLQRRSAPWTDVTAALRKEEGLLFLIPIESGPLGKGVVRIAARGAGGTLVDWVDGRSVIGDSAALYRVVREHQPFDPLKAHALYKALFGGQVESHLQGATHLFIVPGSDLQALPFNALVVDPGTGRLRNARWLDDRYSFSILPNANALLMRPGESRKAAAQEMFLGLGAPLLDGKESECQRSATLTIDASGLGRPDELRGLCALPDGPAILTTLFTSFGSSVAHKSQNLLYGEAATEALVKTRNNCAGAAGDCRPLRDYQIIAFLTHGILANELASASPAEPALVLSPPKTATPADDGLLMLSEIVRLDLNADLVMLLACNTAGPDGLPGGQPLSGLARAFMDAGARNLIVSQWSVGLAPARDIAVAFASNYAQGFGIAESLRKAQKVYRKRAVQDEQAHPARWAPFIIVGGF